MKKKQGRKILLAILGIILLGVIIFVVSFFVGGKMAENDCIEAQILRVEELAELYASGDAEKVDEQSFCTFDLDDISEYQYNDLQVLASHNSYKLYQPTLSYLFASTVYPIVGEDGDVMNYENPTTTEQLNVGIRSFEWDIQEYSGEFDGYIVQHEAYIDCCSSIPNLELAFEEIAMWSEYNEDHMPITIIIECKDTVVPDYGKEDITDGETLYEMSLMIAEVLGDSLYTPSEMLGDYDTMLDMRLDDAYPTLDELQGKIIVILHYGSYCESYAQTVDFDDQLLFTALGDENSCFTIENDSQTNVTPLIEAIEENFIVRTRINEWGYLDYNSEVEEFALSIGANILTSDYLDDQMFDEVSRIDGEYFMCVRGQFYQLIFNSN